MWLITTLLIHDELNYFMMHVKRLLKIIHNPYRKVEFNLEHKLFGNEIQIITYLHGFTHKYKCF